jgi:tRNA dimethylallyltransferase
MCFPGAYQKICYSASMSLPLIIICGPTATGKTALAIEIAELFSGEIISADSRQVYRGLDIGSAKATSEERARVPHHLIDVAAISETFSVADFKELATRAITDIRSRGKLPIICGGTGMYISALIDDHQLPAVDPNPELRYELEQLSTETLSERLNKLDPERARSIDYKNRVRLIRAIEIATKLGTVPKLVTRSQKKSEHEVLMIGLTLPKEILVERITARIHDRIPALFEEIRQLLRDGISADRLQSFGLEYRHGTEFVEGSINEKDFVSILTTKTWQYVRRQMTWFKRDNRITWFNPISDKQKILAHVQDFLVSNPRP